MLLNVLLIVLGVVVVLGLILCALDRQWGTLVFSAVMLGATGVFLLYGAGHIPVG